MAIDNRVVNADARFRFIEMVQKQLIRENPSALPSHGVDGKYGPETIEWVERFQERKGLQVDGVAGPETLGRLRDDIIQRPESSGRGVEILQEDLLFFYIQQSAVDGEYGPGTTQGVRDFQFLNNLVADGVAGPSTLKAMDEQYTTLFVQSGDTGSIVRRIQNQLNDQDEVNISIEVDGDFGSATEQAVIDFQDALGQKTDGIAGPVVMNLLDLEAYHPLQESEMEEALNELGYGVEFNNLSSSEAEEFKSTLESNSAFANNLPSQADSGISSIEVKQITMQDDSNTSANTIYTLDGSLDAENGYIALKAMFDEDKELLGFAFIIVDGDLYDSSAQAIYYDVDGDEIDNVEDDYVEFVNEDIRSQSELARSFSNLSSSQMRIQNDVDIDEEVCEITIAVSVAVACGAPGLAAGTVTAGVAWLAIGGVCSYLFDRFGPDNDCGVNN